MGGTDFFGAFFFLLSFFGTSSLTSSFFSSTFCAAFCSSTAPGSLGSTKFWSDFSSALKDALSVVSFEVASESPPFRRVNNFLFFSNFLPTSRSISFAVANLPRSFFFLTALLALVSEAVGSLVLTTLGLSELFDLLDFSVWVISCFSCFSRVLLLSFSSFCFFRSFEVVLFGSPLLGFLSAAAFLADCRKAFTSVCKAWTRE
mmetsp:Transcript_26935/g.38233  ORF Transcript_26935/g.38233 Transcript_26935/m.38233 type:complete len:203 (+) Transcript_26935:471-1079(+)